MNDPQKKYLKKIYDIAVDKNSSLSPPRSPPMSISIPFSYIVSTTQLGGISPIGQPNQTNITMPGSSSANANKTYYIKLDTENPSAQELAVGNLSFTKYPYPVPNSINELLDNQINTLAGFWSPGEPFKEFLIPYTFIFLTKIPAFASLKNIFFEFPFILLKLASKKLALLKLVSIPNFIKVL